MKTSNFMYKDFKWDKYPLVSVIMPMYKCEDTLRRAIESVIHQDYPNWELLVINDCSPDNSKSIAEEYQKSDPLRITVLNQEVNKGVSAARNLGIDNASGDFITFLDSDDYISSDYIEGLIAPIRICKTQQVVPMVLTGYIQEWENIAERQMYGVPSNTVLSEAINAVGLFSSPWGKLFQADVLRKLNLHFDETQRTGVEDILFVLKYAFMHSIIYANQNGGSKANIIYNHQTSLHYIWNPNGLTGTKDSFTDLIRAFSDLCEYVKSLKITETQQSEFYEMIHTVFKKNVLHWGLHKLIKFNGDIEEAMPYLRKIKNITKLPVVAETRHTYSQLKLGEEILPSIESCYVFMLYSGSSQYAQETGTALLARLSELSPNTKFTIHPIKYSSETQAFHNENIQFQNIADLIEYLQRNEIYDALIYDVHDYIRSGYFKNLRQYLVGNRDTLYLPRNRSVVKQDSAYLEIVNMNDLTVDSIKTLDYKGAFIHLTKELNYPATMYTENDGYLINANR